jgi:hypothetical protein
MFVDGSQDNHTNQGKLRMVYSDTDYTFVVVLMLILLLGSDMAWKLAVLLIFQRNKPFKC